MEVRGFVDHRLETGSPSENEYRQILWVSDVSRYCPLGRPGIEGYQIPVSVQALGFYGG